MEKKAELEEKIARWSRLNANEDYQRAFKEAEAFLRYDQNVFSVLKAGHTHEFVLAKEGGRSVLEWLKSQETKAKAELEALEQGVVEYE